MSETLRVENQPKHWNLLVERPKTDVIRSITHPLTGEFSIVIDVEKLAYPDGYILVKVNPSKPADL